ATDTAIEAVFEPSVPATIFRYPIRSAPRRGRGRARGPGGRGRGASGAAGRPGGGGRGRGRGTAGRPAGPRGRARRRRRPGRLHHERSVHEHVHVALELVGPRLQRRHLVGDRFRPSEDLAAEQVGRPVVDRDVVVIRVLVVEVDLERRVR